MSNLTHGWLSFRDCVLDHCQFNLELYVSGSARVDVEAWELTMQGKQL